MFTDFWSWLQNNWYFIIIGIVALIILIRFLPRYKIAPPDTALIISGLFRRSYKVRNADGTTASKKFGYRIVRGGATFYIPAIERIDQLDMCLTQVDIKTPQAVPTKEYISVLVDAVANIKIGSDDLSIATAAEQLLHYDSDQIKALAKDVLEGNMREIIGQMTIAELVQNRDKFAQESIKAAMNDMNNMGLEIINLTIQNFSDKDGNVIDTMAARNVAEKEQDKRIAEAEAEKEAKFAEMQAEAEIARQNRDVEVQKAAFKQETEEARAKAEMAYKIEQERIQKTYETEHAAAELTRLEKETELKRQEVEIEREKLNVMIREKAQADKDSAIAAADAAPDIVGTKLLHGAINDIAARSLAILARRVVGVAISVGHRAVIVHRAAGFLNRLGDVLVGLSLSSHRLFLGKSLGFGLHGRLLRDIGLLLGIELFVGGLHFLGELLGLLEGLMRLVGSMGRTLHLLLEDGLLLAALGAQVALFLNKRRIVFVNAVDQLDILR